jgi:glycerophosphoryl diester phosphodiesterase
VVALLIALALPQAADAQVSELAVVGHRGASGDRPENTVPALWRAARLGADWVEMDVRATRPGTPVVVHDQWLGRTTTGTGRVRDLSDRRRRNLRAEERWPWYRPTSASYDGRFVVPTLGRMVEEAEEKGIAVLADLKTRRGERRAVALLEAARVPVRVSPHNQRQHAWLVATTDLALMWRTSDPVTGDLIDRLAADGQTVGIVAQRDVVTTAVVDRAHAAGLQVWAWTFRAQNRWLPDRFDVGSSARGYGDMAGWIAEYVALGVDGVVVDEPDRVD